MVDVNVPFRIDASSNARSPIAWKSATNIVEVQDAPIRIESPWAEGELDVPVRVDPDGIRFNVDLIPQGTGVSFDAYESRYLLCHTIDGALEMYELIPDTEPPTN